MVVGLSLSVQVPLTSLTRSNSRASFWNHAYVGPLAFSLSKAYDIRFFFKMLAEASSD